MSMPNLSAIEDDQDGFDIIGDVHGCANALQILLHQLGYRSKNGVFRYAGSAKRSAIFLGDLIDRGPQIRETLAIVKAMVDEGEAQMVLGNHEFSAIAYFTETENGFLRSHNERSNAQIQQTLNQCSFHAKEWRDYLIWFQHLPLFLEFDEFRVVHACWDKELIAQYQTNFGTECLSPHRIEECKDYKSLSFRCVDRLTRGLTLRLPEGHNIAGRDGYLRHQFRVNFWTEDAKYFEDIHFQPDALPETLKKRILSSDDQSRFVHYSEDEKLLFIGHYWLEGEPQPVAKNIACLDYSAVHGGKLVAYRFHKGDKQLYNERYSSVVDDNLSKGAVNG